MNSIKVGDIVWVDFRTAEGGTLKHPALVLSIEKRINGGSYARVAYGSSKKVSSSGCLDREFVITPADKSFGLTGLKVATRIDMGVTMCLPVEGVRPIGRLDLTDKNILPRLKRAMMSAL